jgi:hypothetical protein
MCSRGICVVGGSSRGSIGLTPWDLAVLFHTCNIVRPVSRPSLSLNVNLLELLSESAHRENMLDPIERIT